MNQIDSPYFAAVDLGSNSFHLLVARLNGGQLETVDREKTMVQLARGLNSEGNLSEDAKQRSIECLKRFGERLKKIPPSQVRAVGTKTLRTAQDARSFLKRAEAALGHPIEIVSGFEEARLVYSGLSHTVINDGNQRLVIDIGGASTEFIIGQDQEPELLESLSMGCVAFTELFLRDGLNEKSMRRAYLAARADLELISHNYSEHGWDIAYGTSGTIRAIADLVSDECGGAIITRQALIGLKNRLIEDGQIVSGDVPKLRKEVLPAGIAILLAIFDELEFDKLHIADATLKEGLIFDTLGRLSDEIIDTRIHTVEKLQSNYQIDEEQAERVKNTALHFWTQIECPMLPSVSRTKILRWAAQLHEIGMAISHSGHHHHGYYILRHSDLGGFGRYEQYILANLVRSHRKKLSFERLQETDDAALDAILPIVACLRLAVLINRRRETLKKLPDLIQSGSHYRLHFKDGWLEQHPLTYAGLEQEANHWQNVGLTLEF